MSQSCYVCKQDGPTAYSLCQGCLRAAVGGPAAPRFDNGVCSRCYACVGNTEGHAAFHMRMDNHTHTVNAGPTWPGSA